MTKKFRAAGACVLLISLLLTLFWGPVQADGPDASMFTHVPTYENTHVNTGDQRQDILAVALTQMGYTEGRDNDTKYGSWYGAAYQPWCASFVSWCARQADISTSIVPQASSVSMFRVPMKSGYDYVPQPGDLFMPRSKGHIGFVWYVEGEYFYTVEGNGNDNGSYDGMYVLSVKRRIEDYIFGVPAYEGGDGEHTYVYKCETAHPHKNYYECSDCGDMYYTGSTGFDPACGECTACGCSTAEAGWYRCDVEGVYLPIRTEKSYNDSARIGAVPLGEICYVRAMGNGWAHVEYCGLTGYVTASYLTRYHPKPETPRFTTEQTRCPIDEAIALTWQASANTENYRLQISMGDTAIADLDLGTQTAFTFKPTQTGFYEAKITAANKTGSSQADVFYFTVVEVYQISYTAGEGVPVPEAQRKIQGTALELTQTVPVREGYTFLGWSAEEGGVAVYKSGAQYTPDGDAVLHAVWRDDTAVPQSLAVARMPARTMFVLDEELTTDALALELTWSDGARELVTEGFTVEGFDSSALGEIQLTVKVGEVSAAYTVQIVEYIPGDVNQDGFVNRDDVMYLLWHINFAQEYPVNVPVEFTGDGYVNRDDVMRLLWHINFPGEYPLSTDLAAGSGI